MCVTRWWRRSIALAILCIAVAAGRVHAQWPRGSTLVRVGRVAVVAEPRDQSLAMALAETADATHEWPGLGRVDPRPLALVLVRGKQALNEASRGRAPAWGAAVAMPGPRTIVLNADAGDPLRLLRHELAHLALHQEVRVRLPLWFDEGYATWAAGEWDRLDALSVSAAVVQGALPDFSSLNAALRSRNGDPGAAYALATSAVLELARRNPTSTLTPLLDALRTGTDFDTAVLRTTGFTLDRFEELWERETRRRYGVLTWLIGGGGWLLVAIGVALIARQRRRRDAARRAALDEGWPEPEPLEAIELDPAPRQ